jgi:SOS-response transcriptional repressor LexA
MHNPGAEAVYNFIKAYMAEHERAPSRREIAAACGISPAMVQRHIEMLEAWGKLERGVERGARAIRLL